MEVPRADDASSFDDGTTVAVRGTRVSGATADALLSDVTGPYVAWEREGARLFALDVTATITAAGPDRFDIVQARAETLFDQFDPPEELPEPARPRLFGGFAFTDRDGEESGPWHDYPAAWFMLPGVQILQENGESWLTVARSGADAPTRAERALAAWRDRLSAAEAAPETAPPGVASIDRTPSREGWRAQVRAALERVDGGDLEKVVLAQSLTAALESPLDVPAALGRLRETYPDCYRFALAPPDGSTFFGATPEPLVTRQGRSVHTEALAGSTGRGDTPAEDEWLAADLRDSAKDRHEHQLVVDAIRDQLEPLAAGVRTDPLSVRRLATVQHLQTPITAELHTDDHVLSLVEALHPTPAVGGLPPEAALATIAETEAFDRGWYAGPVGWFDGTGDGEFAVAIRSALAEDDRVTCFAGAGIVADSDPDREWDEVQLKYRPILDVLE